MDTSREELSNGILTLGILDDEAKYQIPENSENHIYKASQLHSVCGDIAFYQICR